MNCIFCKIADGEIPSQKVFESDTTVAFRDINPQAPVHVLVIHRTHTASILDTPAESPVFQELMEGIQQTAKALGLEDDGFRIIINNGRGAGQTVDHLHAHIVSAPSGLAERLL